MLDRSTLRDDRVLEDVGTLWLMHQGQQRARCALMNSADSWELHLIIDGQRKEAQRCPRGKVAFDLAEAWKRRMCANGWRQLRP